MSLTRFSTRNEKGKQSGHWVDSKKVPSMGATRTVLEKGVFELMGSPIDVEVRHPKDESAPVLMSLINRKGDVVELKIPNDIAKAVTHGITRDGEVCAAVVRHGIISPVERMDLGDLLRGLGVVASGVDAFE